MDLKGYKFQVSNLYSFARGTITINSSGKNEKKKEKLEAFR